MEYHNKKFQIPNSKSKIILQAPAKINIGLLVKDKRPDGYHNIETIMVPIKLFDSITIRKTSKRIRLRTNSRKLLAYKNNLVYKAAELFMSETKMSVGLDILLIKNIPIGAGLGGGSSDAASTLLALNTLFGNPLTFNQLTTLAVQIGMDVAFFLYQSSCYATGRGEILKPIKTPKLYISLYLPDYSISTKWAYQNIGTGLTDRDFSLKLLSQRLINNDLVGINELVVNTFEQTVFNKYPDLLRVKNLFIANRAYLASLSGTGSAVYGVFNKNTLRKENQLFDKTILFVESM